MGYAQGVASTENGVPYTLDPIKSFRDTLENQIYGVAIADENNDRIERDACNWFVTYLIRSRHLRVRTLRLPRPPATDSNLRIGAGGGIRTPEGLRHRLLKLRQRLDASTP